MCRTNRWTRGNGLTTINNNARTSKMIYAVHTMVVLAPALSFANRRPNGCKYTSSHFYFQDSEVTLFIPSAAVLVVELFAV